MIWSTRTRWQISPQAPGKTVFIYFLFACLDALNIFFFLKLIYSKFDFEQFLVSSSMNLSMQICVTIQICVTSTANRTQKAKKKPFSGYNFVVTPLICSPSLYVVCTKSLQSCPTLCDLMECSPPGCSVHRDSPDKNTGLGCHALFQGIFQTQGGNPHLLNFLHWQAGSLPLVLSGKPYISLCIHIYVQFFA